jgi:hypothetical protein
MFSRCCGFLAARPGRPRSWNGGGAWKDDPMTTMQLVIVVIILAMLAGAADAGN